ncbi:MAG: fibrobacter succinogenes major paralogous domain-containing protein [Bacteroidota bacterium]
MCQNFLLITAVIIALQHIGIIEKKSEKMNGNVTSLQEVKSISVGQIPEKAEKWIWMEENLNVERFRNGDKIPRAMNAEQWVAASRRGEPAWCYYYNDPANGKKYGKLYNWFAVNDTRGLAPEGWHIPSHDEWNEWIKSLGGEHVAGIQMKSITGWNENGNGTNSSKFNGLPGGYINDDGQFNALGKQGIWWTSTTTLNLNGATYDAFTSPAWSIYLNYNSGSVLQTSNNMQDGFSVRCLKN